MSAGWWADRFTTWYHQRKAEQVLRKHGICPVHFTGMTPKLFEEGGTLIWDHACLDCETEEAERKKNLDFVKIERALRTLLKGKKDVTGHGRREVPPVEAD